VKFGVQLHPEAGVDAVLEEARQADEQGYDTVWLWDHLMDHRGRANRPDFPFENMTLTAAVAAVTKQTKLTWATLNLVLRPPAVFAKILTTLDQISHGRVIVCAGSGWFAAECPAYGLPFREDHAERMDYAREVLDFWIHVWTHPAPELTNWDSKYFSVKDLPFSPEPYTKPHMPIWWGGDSEASVETVKKYADGWVMITSSNKETLSRVMSQPDWPSRPMAMVKGGRIIVGKTHDEAMADAQRDYAAWQATLAANVPPSFEAYLDAQVVGTPDECLAKLAEYESWGINYMRLTFTDEASQERVARLLMPRLADLEERAVSVR
jgi:alkanesulfonate monooxygenase SsuD/methylene tetrahydromethanopterin reductase-like flavin-dependent oxidoreductase (luciferase family)